MKRIVDILIKRRLLLLLLLLIVSGCYGLFGTINSGPMSHHQWRQADCLSITQNYNQDGLPFLEPQIHWQGETNNGKTISEFPIVYYTIGKLWSVSGKHYWMYRALNLGILFLGLIYLKKTIELLIKDKFWSYFIPLLLFTSPILVYYSNNFLMNTTAFGLVLIAGYHFARFVLEKRYLNLVFACLLFTLAGLLKVTGLLLFFAVGAILLYDIIFRSKSLATRWKELIPFAFTLVSIFIWYSYTSWYNSQNLKYIFLQGILPIWEMDFISAANHLKTLSNSLLPEYIHPFILILMALCFSLLLIFRKKAHPYFLALTTLLFMGVGVYLILFFQVFDVHDYYLINLLILVPAVGLLTLKSIENFNVELLSSGKVKTGAILILLFLISTTVVRNRIKYSVENTYIVNSPFIDSHQTEYWKWYHWNYENTFKGLETIEPYLDSIGVTRDKKVISIPDESINISLYLMNRKGFNDFGYSHLQKQERIEWAKEKGAQFLIINDSKLLNEEYLVPYLKNPIGEYKNVKVFKL